MLTLRRIPCQLPRQLSCVISIKGVQHPTIFHRLNNLVISLYVYLDIKMNEVNIVRKFSTTRWSLTRRFLKLLGYGSFERTVFAIHIYSSKELSVIILTDFHNRAFYHLAAEPRTSFQAENGPRC